MLARRFVRQLLHAGELQLSAGSFDGGRGIDDYVFGGRETIGEETRRDIRRRR